MKTLTIQAPTVSSIFPGLDTITEQITALSQENSVSEVLLYSYLNQWVNCRLETQVNLDIENAN